MPNSAGHMIVRHFRAVLLAYLFLMPLSGRLNAAEENARAPFAVPPRFGTITDLYIPKGAPGLQQAPLVVLIQDLHANVGVQKNIASILYRLNRMNHDRGLLVCVEGASGEGDVSLLRSLPGPIRHGFEDMLLRRAYLTGAELAATESAADFFEQKNVLLSRIKAFFVTPTAPLPVSLSPIKLWGVDDPELYRKNWKAAKAVDRMHNRALDEMHGTKTLIAEGASTELQNHLNLVTKLLMLRLQPAEYKEYLKQRDLNPHGSPLFEETLKQAEVYYQAADLRSTAMTTNLLKRMGGTPGLTALVTGGFHTREIAERLKHHGISYVVITPRVEVLDQDQAYRARLREEE